MKKLILDYSTWRCGYNGPNKLGEGVTALLNKEGYMCCLGQFAKQLNSDVEDEELLNIGMPEELDIDIPLLVDKMMNCYNDTRVATKAANINDDSGTTPEEKIKKLKELFAQEGYEIEVINTPNDMQQAHLDGLDGIR